MSIDKLIEQLQAMRTLLRGDVEVVLDDRMPVVGLHVEFAGDEIPSVDSAMIVLSGEEA